MYEADLEADGYVGNLTRVWCWRPDVLEAFTALRGVLTGSSALGPEDWAVLVAATASALGSAYCSLAWGTTLAALADEQTAADVLSEQTDGLGERQRALAELARQVVRARNDTTEDQIESLRRVGLDDRAIFEATVSIVLRLAFSTVNDALGAAPDLQLAQAAPDAVRRAVTYGRTPA